MKPEEMRDDIPMDVREALAEYTELVVMAPDYAARLERVLRPKPRTVKLPAADLPAPLEEVPASGRCWSWYWSHDMEGVTDYTPTREQFAEGLYFATRANAAAWLEHLKSWRNPRPGADWTPHTPGDPMPCDGDATIDVRFRDGDVSRRCKADHHGWQRLDDDRLHDYDIIAWRYAREGEE